MSETSQTSEPKVRSSELVLPQPDFRATKLREAFAAMEQEQWDEYQEYVNRCGGVPISKIKASRPVRKNDQAQRSGAKT